MDREKRAIRGRGADDNPENRFVGLYEETDGEFRSCPKTSFLNDTSKTALSKNDSPDIGFNYSMNP
ncbi:MAG: radical SAM protein, partial [Balneolales bacterium]